MARRFTPEETEKLVDDIRSGMNLNDFMAKNKVSAGVYWRWKTRLKKGMKRDAKKRNPAHLAQPESLTAMAVEAKAAVLKVVHEHLERNPVLLNRVVSLMLISA